MSNGLLMKRFSSSLGAGGPVVGIVVQFYLLEILSSV